MQFFNGDFGKQKVLIGLLSIIGTSAQRWQQMRYPERPGNIELHSVVMMYDVMERVGDSWFSVL